MAVPLSVMQAAAQGDKKAMRLVEQEYGVGDGRRYAENWLSEEEPPPTIPKGILLDSLTNEQIDEYLTGKRGYTQGKSYPVKLAEEAMKKEEEFQIEEDVSAIKRKDAELALQQFSKLKDAELYANMAEQLYTAGFTTEVISGILGMGVAKGAGKETIKGTFGTAEKMVKDPTLPREFIPYDKERIMQNLRDYRETMMKREGYVDVPGSYVAKYADVPSITRRAKAAENILIRMGDESVGAYSKAKPVEGYQDLSSYLKKNVPKSTFGETKMGTRPSRKPIEVKGEVEIPAEPSRYEGLLGMAIPGYDAYQGIAEAQRGKKESQIQQDAIYKAASPQMKKKMEEMGYKPYKETKKREYSTDYRYR
jgi:hypothetical protein